MQLIIDSGSSKMDWVILENQSILDHGTTIGNNPIVDKKVNIPIELKQYRNLISIIHYYSAGIGDPKKKEEILSTYEKYFINAKIINIESDLLGAARACFDNDKGIICILGTGSNVAYYNGSSIIQNTPSLGYILGDEGAGFDIGKLILTAYFYNLMNTDDHTKFKKMYKLIKDDLIKDIYTKEKPNKYIASFSKFLNFASSEFRDSILETTFNRIIEKRILSCHKDNPYKISFVGSIAYLYKEQLLKALGNHGLKLNETIKTPIQKLIEYHKI